ncbi:hypothetical protein FOFC_17778 [Fusarium oxysporum]|nr:hypothetical protein FOFC_17778 [Fusarium oxysporum]
MIEMRYAISDARSTDATRMKPSLLVFAPKGDTDIILRKPNFRSHPELLPEAADPDAAEEENEDEKGEHKEQDD